MKKFYLSAFLVISSFIASNTSAQDLPDSKPYTKPTVIIGKEIGIRISTQGKLGFTYVKHRPENKSFRFRTINTGLHTQNILIDAPSNNFIALSTGGAFAFLKMRQLDNKFTYFHGWEPFIGGYVSPIHFGFYAGIGHTFGVVFDLSEKFNLNMELTPNFGLGMGQFHNGSRRELLTVNSTSGISFSLQYKIGR